jgi:methionyl-tRNA synthetase
VVRTYLTTAIDYANGEPHLGHAVEKIGADVYARYRRMAGDDVLFLIGMDEHGTKVAQAAAARGVTPQQQADTIAESFRRMWDRLGISRDIFYRTTDPKHKKGVTALLERIFERNPSDFYERSYEGWYCVGCEAFKTDNEIVDGRCVLHPTRVLEWIVERNWFFRLSRYAEFLRRHFASHPDFVFPDIRRNEITSLLEQGLEDVSASRAHVAWGIPFPKPTSDGAAQTTYVWFEALMNYLTATGFPDATYEERWPAAVHFVGKDITRFHAVIWPALLESAGVALPEHVWAHGFVTAGGDKMSKSAGVRIELADAVERHGPDALRYYLVRDVPFNGDGEFTWERFDAVYVADLANAFGNLASRTIAMVDRYCSGVVPPGASQTTEGDPMESVQYHAAMGDTGVYVPHEALRAVWRTVARANEYVDREAPWKLAKVPEARDQLHTVLATLVWRLAWQAVHLAPFMPAKAEELWRALGAPGSVHAQRFDCLGQLNPAGWRVTKGAPLFPRDSDVPRTES